MGAMLAAVSAKSQDLTATATLDTNAILIGDQINLLLEVKNNSKYQVSFPNIPDTLMKGVEVVKKSPIDTIKPKDKKSTEITYRQNLVITSYDSGYYAIKPFRFLLNNDTGLYAETEPLLLEVHTIPVNVQADIKDIKGPLNPPKNWMEVVKYVGLGLLALIIITLILIFTLGKKKPSELMNFVQRKPLPPYEVALAKLQALKDKKLWQNGQVKEYHSSISEILREYLEASYGFNAMEQVTDEIMEKMQSKVDDSLQKKLHQILSMADLAKFAKFQPLPDENEQSMAFAVEIVRATKPVEQTEDKKKETKEKEEKVEEPKVEE